jgi:hypothetical protein
MRCRRIGCSGNRPLCWADASDGAIRTIANAQTTGDLDRLHDRFSILAASRGLRVTRVRLENRFGRDPTSGDVVPFDRIDTPQR